MDFRTFTDDELRARYGVTPCNPELRDEIMRRFERDQLGDDLRQRIRELQEEVQELENDLAELQEE
ncbi:hypothetical protein F1536_12550 [Achromobacter xylosoxidans]|uniref:hypothetical protein n=1 Tax=Alcaligenes xylosoxydans xylosoxydans TaxID=85698 RepID=UPI0012319C97|nr:hypothetical protein [Achromobacter xylosoxidans]KAA5926376.1 hypothetical protein F1536_12550 [Achromobacter xylosoxidans]